MSTKEKIHNALLFLAFREKNPKHGLMHSIIVMMFLFSSVGTVSFALAGIAWDLWARYTILIWIPFGLGLFMGLFEFLHIAFDR